MKSFSTQKLGRAVFKISLFNVSMLVILGLIRILCPVRFLILDMQHMVGILLLVSLATMLAGGLSIFNSNGKKAVIISFILSSLLLISLLRVYFPHSGRFSNHGHHIWDSDHEH